MIGLLYYLASKEDAQLEIVSKYRLIEVLSGALQRTLGQSRAAYAFLLLLLCNWECLNKCPYCASIMGSSGIFHGFNGLPALLVYVYGHPT